MPSGVPLLPLPTLHADSSFVQAFPDRYGSPADVPSSAPLVLHASFRPSPRASDEAQLADTEAMAMRMSSSLLDD